jgi:hypothetical protein
MRATLPDDPAIIAPVADVVQSTNGTVRLRRRFFDIAKDGSAPIASEALERIAALYAIEKTIRGHTACERRAVRQEQSKPLVLELFRTTARARLGQVPDRRSHPLRLEPLRRAHPLP